MWLKTGKRYKQIMSSWREFIYNVRSSCSDRKIYTCCVLWKRGGKKISSMHYQWFLRSPAIRIMTTSGSEIEKGNIHIRLPSTGIGYLDFCILLNWVFQSSSGTHIPFSQSSFEILLCFFRCVEECAPEGCKKNLIIFRKFLRFWCAVVLWLHKLSRLTE